MLLERILIFESREVERDRKKKEKMRWICHARGIKDKGPGERERIESYF
jgi:hypothetical protein